MKHAEEVNEGTASGSGYFVRNVLRRRVAKLLIGEKVANCLALGIRVTIFHAPLLSSSGELFRGSKLELQADEFHNWAFQQAKPHM
jgi:hypothetical protein